jgi:prevent-host-death family protein
LLSGRKEFAVPYEVGVREAKAKFSSLLARVRKGGAITITDRGRPVAQLVPLPAAARSLAERLHEMEEAGFLAESPPESGPLPPLVSVPEQGLAQRLLQEDRGAR